MIDRNTEKSLKQDIEFIDDILEKIEIHDLNGAKEMLNDWQHELYKIIYKEL